MSEIQNRLQKMIEEVRVARDAVDAANRVLTEKQIDLSLFKRSIPLHELEQSFPHEAERVGRPFIPSGNTQGEP